MTWFGRLLKRGHPSPDDLSTYMDGRLEPRRQSTLEKHLLTCHSCNSELDSLRVTVAQLRSLTQIPPPRSFTLQQVPSPAFQLRPAYVTALQGAAALVFVVTAVLTAADASNLVPLGGEAREAGVAVVATATALHTDEAVTISRAASEGQEFQIMTVPQPTSTSAPAVPPDRRTLISGAPQPVGTPAPKAGDGPSPTPSPVPASPEAATATVLVLIPTPTPTLAPSPGAKEIGGLSLWPLELALGVLFAFLFAGSLWLGRRVSR
ncbi:MAG: zf-HC2 domain-containing protein [Chloroflexi bacterium]|nr:zf-HC2 domain-containing protein [Chloroflexota bacterium]